MGWTNEGGMRVEVPGVSDEDARTLVKGALVGLPGRERAHEGGDGMSDHAHWERMDDLEVRLKALEARAETGFFGLDDVTQRMLQLEQAQPTAARPVRVRMNVSTSTKGIRTPEVTVDGQDSGATWLEILGRLINAEEALSVKYPVEVPE